MRWGMPWASGWGDPNNAFLYTIPDELEMVARGYTSIPYRIMLAPNKNDGFVGIYRNATLYRTLAIKAGEELNLDVALPWGSTSISLMALYMGQLGTAHDCSSAVRIEEAYDSNIITLTLNFPYEVIEPELEDGSYTSNWNITDAVYGDNTAVVNDHPTWGRLSFALTIDTGIATLDLTIGNRLVATGSAAVGGSLAFAGDINGTVNISAFAADAEGIIDVRWAKAVKIKRGTISPPTVVIATVPFKGNNTEPWTELAELASNTTYFYRTTPVTDTNVDGASSGITSLTTTGVPDAPTAFVFGSGSAANFTLAFTPPVPANTQFRLYLATVVGEVLNLQDVKATANAGASTISYAGGITGLPGTVYALLRAYSTVTLQEEKNNNLLPLEFDGAGVFIPARPNDAGMNLPTLSGLDLSVKGVYNSFREKGTATELRLFSRTVAGAYDFTTPDDTVALSGTNIKSATLSKTFGGAGYYYVTVKAATAGGTLSESYIEQLVYVSAGAMSTPTLSAQLSRG